MASLILALKAPSGLWPSIINWIFSGVGNMGWTIVLFTVLVKAALLPFEFWMKLSNRKRILVQKKIAPQVAAINKKFANDKYKASIQTSALYRKEGINTIGSCLFMLVYLVLSTVVFLTLFNSLRSYSQYNTLSQYTTARDTYVSVFQSTGDQKKAETAVHENFNEKLDSWLWVSNIWKQDTYASVVPSYKEISTILQKTKDQEIKQEFSTFNEDEYNAVFGKLKEEKKGQWNGFFLLAVFTAVLTFLSQWISEKANKVRSQKSVAQDLANPENAKPGSGGFGNFSDFSRSTRGISTMQREAPTQQAGAVDPMAGSTMKFMKIILPLVMVIFVFTSSASFGIYIVTSSIFAIAVNLLMNSIIMKLTKNQEEQVVEVLGKIEQKNKKRQEKKDGARKKHG